MVFHKNIKNVFGLGLDNWTTQNIVGIIETKELNKRVYENFVCDINRQKKNQGRQPLVKKYFFSVLSVSKHVSHFVNCLYYSWIDGMKQ